MCSSKNKVVEVFEKLSWDGWLFCAEKEQLLWIRDARLGALTTAPGEFRAPVTPQGTECSQLNQRIQRPASTQVPLWSNGLRFFCFFLALIDKIIVILLSVYSSAGS